MPVLEIITIGTELLLGEITDTNSTYIARTLRDHGIDIYRITTIGDNPSRIAVAIQEALDRADIVITTGGLGPTIDDPTREAVANATHRELVFMSDLWDQILERFKAYGRVPTENNRRQAHIPQGAIPIPNPVGTAPCFIIEQDTSYVISLPGVPQEMEYILHHSIIPFLKSKFDLQSQTIKATVLHAASMGESMIDELISDLEEYPNPTVGLLAHPGQVDIRVTAKASSENEAVQMIKPILEELHRRLGENIYGYDEDTLEGMVGASLDEKGLRLCLIDFGMGKSLSQRFHQVDPKMIKFTQLNRPPENLEAWTKEVSKFYRDQQCDLSYGLALMVSDQVYVYVGYQDATQREATTWHFGGPKENALLWAQNIGLDFLRRKLCQFNGKKGIGAS